MKDIDSFSCDLSFANEKKENLLNQNPEKILKKSEKINLNREKIIRETDEFINKISSDKNFFDNHLNNLKEKEIVLNDNYEVELLQDKEKKSTIKFLF